MSSICGGIIALSQVIKNLKSGNIWADMMAYVMPDNQYHRYIKLKKEHKDKEATKVSEKYARSQI